MGKHSICNTGESDTAPEVSIDYLSITFPAQAGVLDQLKRVLGGTSLWLPIPGRHGFQSGLQLGKINIFFDGYRCIWIELRGQGCRQIEAHRRLSTEQKWIDFLDELYEWGSRVNRIDIAIDDRKGLVKMGTVFQKMRKGDLTARFRGGWECKKHNLSDGKVVGEKAIFGGAQADYQVAIYDKNAEQQEKGVDSGKHWTRVEVRASGPNAVALSRAVQKDGFKVVLEDLRARLSFRVAPKGRADSNKSRWKVCPWWEKFLNAKPLLIPRCTCESIQLESLGNLIRQYGPSLRQLAQDEGEGAVENLLLLAKLSEAKKDARRVPTIPPPESSIMKGVQASRQLQALIKGADQWPHHDRTENLALSYA